MIRDNTNVQSTHVKEWSISVNIVYHPQSSEGMTQGNGFEEFIPTHGRKVRKIKQLWTEKLKWFVN